MAFSKMLNVLAILFAITYVRDATTKSCKPGSMVKQADGCNYCKCSPVGELEPCTIRTCSEVAEHLRTRKFPILAPETGCLMGRRMTTIDGCYSCYCRSGRVFRCFDKPACLKEDNIFDEDGRCTKPGLRLRSSNFCKQCMCNEDGTLICHLNREKCRICYPGRHFMPDGDCNICKCSDDGMSALACTNEKCSLVRSVKHEPCNMNGNFTTEDGASCMCMLHMMGVVMCNVTKSTT